MSEHRRARRRQQSDQTQSASERGAVLLIVAMLTLVMLISAGFAVDFGAWYTRAEELQQIADSAALAGVADYVASGNDEALALAKINEVLLQNGFDPTDVELRLTTEFDADTGTVRVTVGDEEVDVFFGALVPALGSVGIARSANAELDRCGTSCVQELEIPRPLDAASFSGSGDGWEPILMGDRIFAINHHTEVETGGDIVCVDRSTQALCAGYPMNISPLQPAGTDWTVPTAIVGSRIFYHAQRSQDFVMGCFDTATDAACGGGHIVLANLPDPGGDHDYQSRGGATILSSEGLIYAFSEEQAFCVDPATYAICGGYPAANGFADAGIVAGTLSGAQQSSLQIGDRVYVSHTWYLEQQGLGSRVHCWDIVAADACVGFGSVQMHPSGDPSGSGRLFAIRTTTGLAYGVCSIQTTSVECVDLDGIALPEPPGFEIAWSAVTAVKVGTPLYHERSNRLLVPSRSTNETFCYDFAGQTSCGVSSAGITGDYGYAAEGDCIYGLGHESLFWTFRSDLSQGCRSAVTTDRIYACQCNDGTKHWGSVVLDADLDSSSGPFQTLEIRVWAPDDTEFINQSMLDTNGAINLGSVPTTYDYLNVEVLVTAKVGQDPWLDGSVPAIEVGWRDRPHLTN